MRLATALRKLTARSLVVMREVGRDRELWIAGAVSVGTVLLLALTATQGFVRDEGYYFRAAADYHRWFEGLWQNLWQGRVLESFGDAALTRAFGYNTEHPGLVKILMGWTWKVFHQWLGWTGAGTGYRLASIGMVGVGNGFLYLLGARMMSRRVGLLAVALLLASPHVFYHFHLACFDGPIVAATVAVVYGFWRSLSSRPWILGAGLVWGIAAATKHNAVFLLPTLGLAFVLARLHELRLTPDRRLALPPIPWAFFAMVIVGPILFYLFYPYGWHDPLGRIGAYYGYHLHHEHYPVDFFGTMLTEPPFPWSFPFVMTAITVPLMVLVPGVVGWGIWLGRAIRSSIAAWRGQSPETPAIDAWLLVISTAVPVVIIAVPTVPIFGGTKHWMPMMPFLCLLGAWVIMRALEQAVSWLPRWRRPATVLGVIVVLVVPIYETARSHPLGHTYFNELALGHAGGAALGMPRTFWGGDARELLPVLNERAAERAKVFTDRMNHDDFRAYQKDGLLRSDLRWSGEVRAADWALINHQREFQDNEYKIWALVGDRRPEAVVAFDGVPIVSLYQVRGRTEKRRVALVVLDGFGLAESGPGNAVAQALAERPEGLLARALVNNELPWVPLDAAGACVGLPAGMNGNSEAGHNNMCAGGVVEQARVSLDALVAAPEQATHLVARAEKLAAAGKPLHVIVYLAATSSVGHFEHVLVPLRIARRAGVEEVWVHGVCDGRESGGCTPVVERVRGLMAAEGIGRFATITGRKYCWSRTGLDDGVRACVAGMTAARTGAERGLDAALAASAADDGHSHLEPTPLAGSPTLGAGDEIRILPYRRDVLRGVVQALRVDPGSGPDVVTTAYVDAESHFADDPHLILGLEKKERGGLLQRRLATAGLRQLRVSESGKAGHVTYFCDGGDVPEGAYARVHPTSAEGDYGTTPCLRSVESTQAARDAVARGDTDFILMNLPNADILGHTSEVDVAVAGIHCAERLLERFVREASARGFAVFITADHGNAEAMLTDGELNRSHTNNPVPFIAIAPRGRAPFVFKQRETPACLGAAAWTVLDALGLEKAPESLLER